MQLIPDACLRDGKFCPRRTDDCSICPLWTGWVKLAKSVFPRSVIVGALKEVIPLLLDHPERPPGICGWAWDRQNT